MPEATATIDSDGWLHTGDLASLDERGYLRIGGRLTEMINRAGVKNRQGLTLPHRSFHVRRASAPLRLS